MHITRVELENIKVYKRAEYTFDRGTIAIVGQNGAGKTTILEAIAWALFDTLEYNKDDFLRRGAKKGSVRVTFESDHDGRQYTIYRDTGQGYYVHDPALGVRVVERRGDVRAFLNQHLGIEAGTDLKALFSSAIGVPQGAFTADFLRPASQRKAAFDRLLKVEEYRESAERLRDTINLIRDRVTQARERIAGAEGQLGRYDDLVAEQRAAQARAEELDELLFALRREAEERARAVGEMDAAERRVNDTFTRAERLAVEQIAAARRLADLRSELAAAEQAREQQRASEEDYRVHLTALDTLRALEAERAARDRLRAGAERIARLAVEAAMNVRRSEEAAERAARARAGLTELAREVTEQEELERERERLRDLQAHARAAHEQLLRLDRELSDLRTQHVQTRERVRAAEGGRGAEERVEALESERLRVETELSRVENALTARRHLETQRAELAHEVERLRRSVETLEREARDLNQRAAGAERAGELEARVHELTTQAARLRAEIKNDERILNEVKGGLCPILGDRCLSIGKGQPLDGLFADSLAANHAKLAVVERESAGLIEAVTAARRAVTAAAQLERERTRLTHERSLLAQREARLAGLDNELAKHADITPARLDQLQAELTGTDLVLKNAREDARRYAELEPLRRRLKEIEEEGKRRKDEREGLAAAAGAAAALAADIDELERRLRALNDPRGRAAALRLEAEGVDQLAEEMKAARAALDALELQKGELDTELEQFRELDAKWATATAVRDGTADAYREHLAAATLAATLPAREAEARAAAAKAQTAQIEAENARATHHVAAAAYDRERHDNERGQLSLARERAAATAAQLEAARARAAELGAEISRLDEVREQMRDEFRAKERLEELHETTDFVRDILKEAGPLVTESYLYNISIEANQLFREITGEGGRALRWSKDYEIILEEGGHERSFTNLSGGEQMAAALAIRLALLKHLSDIRIAFFDEPTINMDAERRARLAEQIKEIRHFDQLFIISHDDTFENSVSQVVAVARATGEAA